MTSVTAFGQMKFGVKAGGNVSNLSGIDWNDGRSIGGRSAWTSSFHAGGYVNYSFSDILGAQAEVVFSIQGGKYVWDGEGKSYIIDENGKRFDKINGIQRMNYVNVPLLLDIKPFSFPLNILVGPQFGYCVSRSFVDGRGGNDSEYKNLDFAAALGVQYTFIEHLTLGFRGNIGLTPSVKYDYTVNNETRTAKGERNNVLQLSAGWTF